MNTAQPQPGDLPPSGIGNPWVDHVNHVSKSDFKSRRGSFTQLHRETETFRGKKKVHPQSHNTIQANTHTQEKKKKERKRGTLVILAVAVTVGRSLPYPQHRHRSIDAA